MQVIIKNTTLSGIMISDLGGLTISGSGSEDVSLWPQGEITASKDLKDYVTTGTLVINNGTEDLDCSKGCKYLTLENREYVDDITKIISPYDLENYLDLNCTVIDPYTMFSGGFIPMSVLLHRRELYNDDENPLCLPGFTPLLGVSGTVVDAQNRILNLEDIHSDDGWHSQEVKRAVYVKPENLLIYYGWLNSFNYAKNSWDNEKIAQDMSKYTLIVFGDGIQDPGHGDYSNTAIIIPRVKALNPDTKIFGYVTVNQSLSNFETKAGQWNDLEITGIFMDEAGYDYGTTRSGLNDRIDYTHNQNYANICFVNAWNMDHIIGTENDVSYPNSTYNPALDESNLTYNDWYLLESFPINTAAYTSTGGYESRIGWFYRGNKAIIHRSDYGINLAACGIINNSNNNGKKLSDFGFTSSLMWSLEGFGTSDTSYASSSATVGFWSQRSVNWVGKVWDLSPIVRNDVSDNDKYYRYVEFAKLTLDFSSSAQKSFIENYDTKYSEIIKFGPGELIEGVSEYPIRATAGPITALTFSGTLNQYTYGSLEVPDKWRPYTDIDVKVKFMNDYSQDGTKVCRWCLDYHTYDEFDTYGSKTTTTLYNNYSLTNNPSADTLFVADLTMEHDDAHNPIDKSKLVTFKFYRDSEDAADTMEYGANLILVTFAFEKEAT